MLLFTLLACLHGAPEPEAQPDLQRVQVVAQRAPAVSSAIAAVPVPEPRTRHLAPDGSPIYTNRLVLETSPYLQQHAHNPVDWMPWGDEAFALAARLGRPVLLSVGYATCHWCHVMEEESFEDEEIAAYINAHFVPIKVDREERPDVDAIYMTAVQAMTGRGGWPMTLFLTDKRRPFFAATYLPARDGDRGRSVGFLTTLQRMQAAYIEQPGKVAETSAQLTREIQKRMGPRGAAKALPGIPTLESALKRTSERYDPIQGGGKGQPKFPSHTPVRWLLQESRRTGADEPKQMALNTLQRMGSEGIHDQVGGGFHRYSVDAQWRVPHFEKMLYDNALLAMAYTDAWQLTGDPVYRTVAERTLRFMDRELSTPKGGLMSAIDADSPVPGTDHREEGWFYTWTPSEVAAVLGPVDVASLGISSAGDLDGRSIPHVPTLNDLEAVRPAYDALFAARASRPRPLTDTKVIAAWNGLALSAVARAGRIFDEPALIQRAERLAEHLVNDMVSDGRVARIYNNDTSNHHGMLEDHAAVAAGLLDLFEATADTKWLTQAIAIDGAIHTHFEQPTGGWYRTPDDGESLLAREHVTRDGAEPSGASLHILTLYRLAALTSDDAYRQRGDLALQTYASALERGAFNEMLPAVDWRHSRVAEIVVVRAPGTDDQAILDVVRKHAPRNHVQIQGQQTELPKLALSAGKTAIDDQTTVYLCEAGLCQAPAQSAEALRKSLSAWTDP